MNGSNVKSKNNVNNKVDVMYKIWLGLVDMFQTFEKRNLRFYYNRLAIMKGSIWHLFLFKICDYFIDSSRLRMVRLKVRSNRLIIKAQAFPDNFRIIAFRQLFG